jgi:hypothetical protein
LLALLAALATGGLTWQAQRSKSTQAFLSNLVLGAASASVAFVLLSIFVWLFSRCVSMSVSSDHQRLAALIAAADSAVVFTGAGISTESGIPDFRSRAGFGTR